MGIAALMMVLATGCTADDVVILRPNAYLAENPDKIGEATRFLNIARGLLDEIGLEHHTVDEAEVLDDGLPEDEFLLCAYSPSIPADVIDEIEGYLDGGGHALFCFYLPDRLRRRLELEPLEYTPAGGDEALETITATDAALPNQPRSVRQASWNAHLTAPTGDDVRVAGKWLDADGNESMGAALLVGPEAAFLGHVLTEEDDAAKGALLASVIDHYEPGTWKAISGRALARVFEFRHVPDVEALRALCPSAWYEERLDALEKRARRIEMQRMAGRQRKALRQAQALRNQVERLYVSCLPSGNDELRGAWVVMPAGVGDWGWEKTARVARRNGLNALFVRVEWRGIAHYQSDILRVDEDVTEDHDPLQDAITACHRHGIQVHAWFINNNWRTPPQDLIDEFTEAGRWQFGPDGQPRVLEGGDRVYWLNPSDPRNVQLQADFMSEVARKYEVDGVHFDYIRYENYSGSYGEADRERFEHDTGLTVRDWPNDVLRTPRGPLNDAFLEWRVDQVSNVVRACSEAVKAASPDCKVSAAVYPAWPAHRLIVGQDWPKWLREGWIDFVCPMNYDAPSYHDRHDQRVKNQREAAGDFPLYSGIGSWLLPSAADVADQIVNDRANGADGFLLFSLTEELGDEVLPKLRRGPLRGRARAE